MSYEQIIKWFKSAEWDTKKALIVYPAGFIFILGIFATALQKIGINLNKNIFIAFFIISSLLYVVSWLLNRFYFNDKNIIIAFGINTSDDSSKKYYKEIIRRVTDQVGILKLEKKIKIRVLPNDKVFKNTDNAEKFIDKNGINLLL